MMLPQPITSQTGKIGIKITTRTFFTSQRIVTIVLICRMLTPKLLKLYLHGGLQVFTLKSLRRTNQYIPHYSGLVGTNINFLQVQSLQAVLNFFPKYESL